MSGTGDGRGDAEAHFTAGAERVLLKDRVLETAFGHAAFDGWTRRTLFNAASSIGLDRADAQRLFPRGGDSLIGWIDDWADRRMLETVSPGEALPVRARIKALIAARLAALSPHKEAVRRAIVLRALPQNSWATLENLWRTVDRTWEAAGFPMGREHGLGRYTRRITLAGVLTATALYWLEDKSPGDADTLAFLDRRIDDVMRLGRPAEGLSRFTQRFRRPRSRPAG